MTHLLVTNDYPPKVGGIQNYLWELWRRLPPDEACVLTRPHPGDAAFDAAEAYRIVRTRQPFLLPEPWLARQINTLVDEIGADLVMYDPAVPVGAIAPRLPHRYGVILHGAEVTVPGRLPGSRTVLGRVLRGAEHVVTAGAYSTNEAERAAGQTLPVTVIPPGVDTDRFRPLADSARVEARRRYGITPDQPVVLGVSRLVPRKGFDVVIRAAARLRHRFPDLVVLIAGDGRDRARLERLAAASGADVRFLGRVPDAALAALYGMADLFTMMCRVRWGGLEQEGFGIVFLEAAAAGIPQVAGQSGGSAEAVVAGETGLVLDDPTDPYALADAVECLLSDPDRRSAMGAAARRRAVEQYSYDLLADRLLRLVTTHGHR